MGDSNEQNDRHVFRCDGTVPRIPPNHGLDLEDLTDRQGNRCVSVSFASVVIGDAKPYSRSTLRSRLKSGVEPESCRCKSYLQDPIRQTGFWAIT